MENIRENSRISYLDVAKGIGIILVVMGHTGFLKDAVSKYIFSFHMPLFFVISGMLINLKHEENKDFGETIRKKAKALLIPYVSFSVIYIIISLVENYFGVMSKEELIQGIIYMFTFYGDSTLWFLPALLISEVLFIFLMKRMKGHLVFIISVFLGVIAFVVQTLITPVWASHTDSLLVVNLIDFLRVFLRGIIAESFVATGFFGYKYIADSKNNKLLDLAKGIALLILTYGVSYFNDTVDFHRVVLGNYASFLLAGILGSFGIIILSKAMENVRILAYFGRNSLIVMCTHLRFYVLFGAINLAFLVNMYVTRAKDYIFMLVVLVSSFLLEALIIEIIVRFLPFLIGKSNKKC